MSEFFNGSQPIATAINPRYILKLINLLFTKFPKSNWVLGGHRLLIHHLRHALNTHNPRNVNLTSRASKVSWKRLQDQKMWRASGRVPATVGRV